MGNFSISRWSDQGRCGLSQDDSKGHQFSGLRETPKKDINPKSPSSDAQAIYLREIQEAPLLSANEERDLAELARSGDPQARDKMIVSNLRLVVKLARRYLNHPMGLMDLIEEGNIGLMHAIEKFEPSKGYRFSTYASWWIRHEIERAIMNQSRTVRLPIHVAREVKRYHRLSMELAKQLQHEPSISEMAEVTEQSVGELSRLLAANHRIASMDAPLARQDESFTLLDSVASKATLSPETLAQIDEVNGQIQQWLSYLNDREREVLERRFALNRFKSLDRKSRTLERVASDVGLTRERVRQIQIRALKKLRSILEKTGLSWDDVSRS